MSDFISLFSTSPVIIMKLESNIKITLFALFDKDGKTNTTDEQMEKDCETISQGTHTCIGFTAAKRDVKLYDREVACYTFCIQACLLDICKLVLL